MSMENELIKSIVNLIKDSSKIMYNQGEAAEALGMSPSALTQAIKRGDGPRFTCIGGRAKYYTKAALITFAESMPSYASMDEFFEQRPEYRPRDENLVKFMKNPKPPLTCLPTNHQD